MYARKLNEYIILGVLLNFAHQCFIVNAQKANILDFKGFKKFTAAEFKVEDEGLTSDTKIHDLPQWNSLNALLYISSIKETFDVAIKSADLASKKTLGELFELIEDRKSNGV